MTDYLSQLASLADITLSYDEPCARHTTFQIGGPARVWCRAGTTEALVAALSIVQQARVPMLVLGGGSNVLVSDQGFAGVVIQAANSRLSIDGDSMSLDAGVSLGEAVEAAAAVSLSGLEWAVGIPGAVGGAVRGNAGAYRGEMKDSVINVTVWREGQVVELTAAQCQFGYRDSVFKSQNNSDIVLSTRLQLTRGDQAASRARMDEILAWRVEKFGTTSSAGSVFQNILVSEGEALDFKARYPEFPDEFVRYRKIPAAWLIDQCGLRETTIGGAGIYEKHAGIIINRGGATAEDVVILISLIKQKVRVKFGLQLQEEIQYIGF